MTVARDGRAWRRERTMAEAGTMTVSVGLYDAVREVGLQGARAQGALQGMYELTLARAARAYGQLDEYLRSADLEGDTSQMWAAREQFLGILGDFQALEKYGRGKMGASFDQWLDKTREYIIEDEMKGRRFGHVSQDD